MTDHSSRELILQVLLLIEDGMHSQDALRAVLGKYQFLPRKERAFITRVSVGTLDQMIRLDYILDAFSKIPVSRMKPVIRQILRMSVYQLYFMDAVPDRAVCDEAVRLTQKKGFYNLKGFVNGVLRTIAREKDTLVFPDAKKDLKRSLSVRYSMPEELVERWLTAYGEEITETMLEDFLKEKPVTIRIRDAGPGQSREAVLESLAAQGAAVTPAPYLPYAYTIKGFDHLLALDAFVKGMITVQDVSSMLAGECAGVQKGDSVLDLCAAPGGKSIHLGDLMEGYGSVDARDVSPQKVALIEENILRTGVINVSAKVGDATVFDLESEGMADIVLCDVPCSGYGVIGKKPDIKYKDKERSRSELTALQRAILTNAAEYVKPRGVLLYTTCTIAREENEDMRSWFLENFPFEGESLNPYLPEALCGQTSREGYLQLLPGVHACDGFFIARFRRKGRDEGLNLDGAV